LAVLPNKIDRHDGNDGNAAENSYIRTSTIKKDIQPDKRYRICVVVYVGIVNNNKKKM
jgi:hypothetical protein